MPWFDDNLTCQQDNEPFVVTDFALAEAASVEIGPSGLYQPGIRYDSDDTVYLEGLEINNRGSKYIYVGTSLAGMMCLSQFLTIASGKSFFLPGTWGAVHVLNLNGSGGSASYQLAAKMTRIKAPSCVHQPPMSGSVTGVAGGVDSDTCTAPTALVLTRLAFWALKTPTAGTSYVATAKKNGVTNVLSAASFDLTTTSDGLTASAPALTGTLADKTFAAGDTLEIEATSVGALTNGPFIYCASWDTP